MSTTTEACPTCGRRWVEELSPARRRLWDAITGWVDEHGRKPTYDELSEALGMARSTLHEHVGWFREHGWLEWSHAEFRIYRECEHG